MSRLPESSQTEESVKRRWRTPPALVAAIVARYGSIDTDAAATQGEEIADVFEIITPEADALDPRPWRTVAQAVVFLNPPWGREPRGTATWVRRALEELDRGRIRLLLLLVPECTDTTWWWTAAGRADEVLSLGRVAYCRPDGTPGPQPPQGSTLFVIRPDRSLAREVCLLRRWNWRDAK